MIVHYEDISLHGTLGFPRTLPLHDQLGTLYLIVCINFTRHLFSIWRDKSRSAKARTIFADDERT